MIDYMGDKIHILYYMNIYEYIYIIEYMGDKIHILYHIIKSIF